jgi:hypothetical protein
MVSKCLEVVERECFMADWLTVKLGFTYMGFSKGVKIESIYAISSLDYGGVRSVH